MDDIKLLKRDTKHKVIAGVCSGIARYFKTDPVLIRVIAIVLACCAGGGIFAYLLAWIIIPAEDNLQG